MKITGLFLALTILSFSAEASDLSIKGASASNPCSSSEKWDTGSSISQEWKEEFQKSIEGKISPAKSFSEAMALRKMSPSNEAKLFSEYWISRSLLNAKMIHVAQAGFAAVASNPLTQKTVGIETAAIGCLNEINKSFPSIPVPESVTKSLSGYFIFPVLEKEKEVLWQASLNFLETQLEDNRSNDNIIKTAHSLTESKAYSALANGLIAAKKNNHKSVIVNLEKFLSPEVFKQNNMEILNQVRLILSRSYYSIGQYDRAVSLLKQVDKRSNELSASLSELAWSYLMADRYSEAIGTGFSLQSGGMRHTFAPEGPMVMAMALNELCQYPQSLRTINGFRKNYEKSYRWLNEWNHQKKSAKANLYALALQYVRKEKNGVPDRVASEWVRSPLFISNQEEVNLLFDEKKYSSDTGIRAIKELKGEASDIRSAARDLKKKIKSEKSKQKIYLVGLDGLSQHLISEIIMFKKRVIHFKRFKNAGSNWQTILGKQESSSPLIKKRILSKINSHLEKRSFRMLNQIEEIAENNQFIEVEIFNGASQDVIWQNAHPDYKEVVSRLNDEQKKSSKEKVWNWGKAAYNITDDEESHEIWEDELGSFKADLFDNCSSKERYLSVKLNK